MKVLHFSALDGQTGAGVAAARIHNGLLARGIESRFCVVHPTIGLENAFTPNITITGRIARKARRAFDDWMVRPLAKGYDYVLSTGTCGFDVDKIVDKERPDIVQLHWIGGHSFRLASLAGIRKPVVWRLSDQWPFCGVQHLEPDATAYVSPPLGTPFWLRTRRGFSEQVRRRKAAIYEQIENLVLVCPSRWLVAETKISALLGRRPVELIPTSCDTALFSPKDRYACRAALGLSPEKYIVLVGATSMATRWKGLDLFVAAIRQLCKHKREARSIEIVTFGNDAFDPPLPKDLVGVSHFGPVRDRRLMSVLYNAGDVFAAPSRMENLANTVLESLACGTPVVAFAIGGMPDMIDHKENGFLATPFSTAEFGEGIQWAFDQRDHQRIRAACRQKVLDGFSVDREIQSYLSLYEGLLCRSRGASLQSQSRSKFPRRGLRVAKGAMGRVEGFLARSRWASRFYFFVVSALSRRLLMPEPSRRMEALVCQAAMRWPALQFRALSATLANATRVKLIPHLGEFDQSVLFRQRLDYEAEVFCWLESQAVSRYDAVIEIGANIGVYSLFFDALIKANSGARLQKVIAFEPSLEAYSRLLDNLRANNAQHVIPIRAAVAKEAGFLEFFEPEGHLTNGSLVRDFATMFSDRLNCEVVFAHGPSDLEYFLKRYAKVLIKIDIEGYEPELLQSLGETALKYKPDFIVEVLAQTVGKLKGIDWLKEYDFFHLDEDGLSAKSELFASDCYRDWLLAPNSKQ